MMHPLVDHADQEEHASRANAVGDHLEHGPAHGHRPVIAVMVESRRGAPHADAQQHVAHVAHRTVGDQPLEILLGQRRQRSVHHAHRAEPADQPGQLVAGVGTDRVADADHAVSAHLQQHAGQDHRDRRRRLDVGIGQPRMQRHRRQLDDEPDQQQQERPPRDRLAPEKRAVERISGAPDSGAVLADLRQRQHVERVRMRRLDDRCFLVGGLLNDLAGDQLVVRFNRCTLL